MGRPPGSRWGGGHHPLRLAGPAEPEGETRQDVTASEPAQRHLLLRPHRDGGKIEPQQQQRADVIVSVVLLNVSNIGFIKKIK